MFWRIRRGIEKIVNFVEINLWTLIVIDYEKIVCSSFSDSICSIF